MTGVPVFPDGYPTDLLEKIINKGGTFTAYRAYRVAKYGLEDPRSFLSTYQEKVLRGVTPKLPPNKKPKNLGLSEYSTSCFNSMDKPRDICKTSMINYPKAVIVKGVTCPACGPTKLNTEKGHIDWWLYKDTKPHMFFSEIEVT